MKRRLEVVLLFLCLLCVTARAGAQSLAAITSPANGTMTADFTLPITWASVAGAEAYYLYVGTTAGAKDIVNSGETHATSYLASNVPAGQLLYARLWTKTAGTWRYTESTFGAFVARLTSPANAFSAADLLPTFQWNAVTGAQAYYLYVGTSPGAKDLVDTGEIQTQSYAAKKVLPAYQWVYARLWTKAGGVWRYSDSTLGAFTSTLTAPLDKSTTADFSKPITWVASAVAEAYYLYVGRSVGANDLINTGEIHQTSFSAASLPKGEMLYARIWTKLGGRWYYRDSSFGALVARVVTPIDGALTFDLSLPIQWSSIPTAQAYYLYVGTTPGAKDVVNTGEIHQTTYQPRNLPPGQMLYARLWTEVGGVWRFTDSTFGAFVATLTWPPDGLMTADLTRPLAWTAVPSASAYYVYVGTSPGAKDVVDSGEIQRLSLTASNLPKGRVLYVKLWTKVGNAWGATSSTFGNLVSTVTSPPNGSMISDLSQPITWAATPNAEAYYLMVGTTPGAKDLVNTGETQQTSYAARNLPVNQTLYLRLWTKVAGVWRYADSTAGQFLARLTYPIDGSVTADLSQPFRWTSVASAEAYYLYVGTTRGAKDVVNTGEVHQTSWLGHVSTSQTLYARLWTKIGGSWGYVDSSFSDLVSTLTYPQQGATDVTLAHAFQWTAVPDAQAYRLSLGTTAGAADLDDTGETALTSYLAHALPQGRTIYARLQTKSGGVWRYVDSTFAVLPSERLVQASDLLYQGAFSFPWDPNQFGRAFDYGGTAIAFNQAHNSLFGIGHLYDQMTSEVTIPTPGFGDAGRLPRGTTLQRFTAALEGHLLDVAPDPSATVYVSGQLVYNNQLYVAAHLYYSTGQLASHFVRPVDLSVTGALRGPFPVGPLGTNYYSGYFGEIPEKWRLALGGPVLVGDCCLNVISRTSYGPAAAVLDPANIGQKADAAMLVFYPDAHQTLGPWNAQSTFFNGTTEITGVVFPEGTQSVLFFGRQGIGPYCYGEADACNDPAGGTKGDHAYPYVYQVWAYDAAELVKVHNGTKQPWDVVPYAVWQLNLPYQPAHGTHVGGATYDPATGRIFVSQAFANGDEPVVHVFTLTP